MLGRQRQEDLCEFETSLVNEVRFRTASTKWWDPAKEKEDEEEEEEEEEEEKENYTIPKLKRVYIYKGIDK